MGISGVLGARAHIARGQLTHSRAGRLARVVVPAGVLTALALATSCAAPVTQAAPATQAAPVTAATPVAQSAPTPAAAAAPGQLTKGYLDVRSGDYLQVQLDPASPAHGNFVIAIPHLGLIWPTGRATVTVESPSSTELRYAGDGFKDGHANLDPEFGVRYRQQGPGQAVHLRVLGHVDPAHGTASVQVWVDGRLTNLVTEPVPSRHTAADAATAYLAALKHRDWAAMYAMADSDLRGGVSLAQFAQGMGSAPEAQSITGATADTPSVATNEAGVTYAHVSIHLTYDGKPTRTATLVLILQGTGWKLFTVK